ncbi:MAG: Crp/Fnr family transcriptional regulator [Rhodospirillales bacterium RIFCSPLOWO2_12_FULL_58_28]|nr:MAG: Crp/Fnr family transcriptional regulator [Rhodospirillales bacterium RIFCSPLOWO2_02_FULL_58_16]OHC79839.1 MAG: Crp/Fnr family transcriptional regulator [Rhodospirillales bacterium RIFCSPLOWO2_12_FULL_58_28]
MEGFDKLMREHHFFRNMAKESCRILSGCAKNERFDADACIIREGDPADKFYLIRDGAVALELHMPGKNPIILETLHTGDIFGWSWIVSPYKWSYDARAVKPTRLISLEAKCLRKKIKKNHTLGFDLYSQFIPVMGKRLNATRLQMIDIYGKS